MSIDLQANRLELKEVATLTGVTLNTVWRWCLSGVRGHKLESFRIGHRRYVAADALKRFIAAQNPGDDGQPGSVSIPERPSRSPASSQAHANAG